MVMLHNCEYTKNQWTLKSVTCVVCELYLNNAVKRRKRGGGGKKVEVVIIGECAPKAKEAN